MTEEYEGEQIDPRCSVKGCDGIGSHVCVTADHLDPEAEARIREACGNNGWVTFHEEDPECCCNRMRALLKADREARPIINGIDWSRDILQAERAHADALASRLRAHTKGHEGRHTADSCPDCSLLAAHDKLRG